jgi:hypothetical protein
MVLSFQTSGCSLAFMTKPSVPVAIPNRPVECTTSRAAPVLDTVCTASFVALGSYGMSLTDCGSAMFGERCIESDTRTRGVLLAAGLAMLCGISAATGFGQAVDCQEVKDLNAVCMAGDLLACRQLRPGWAPATPPPAPPGGSPLAVPPQATTPPAAPPPAMPPTEVRDSAPAAPGCTKDADCQTGRTCVSGTCVEPAR